MIFILISMLSSLLQMDNFYTVTVCSCSLNMFIIIFLFECEKFSICSDFLSCFVAMFRCSGVEMIDPCRFMRRSAHALLISIFS
jgi:hypothetical protein